MKKVGHKFKNKCGEAMVYKLILSVSNTLLKLYYNYYMDKYNDFESFVKDIHNIDKQEILYRKEK